MASMNDSISNDDIRGVCGRTASEIIASDGSDAESEWSHRTEWGSHSDTESDISVASDVSDYDSDDDIPLANLLPAPAWTDNFTEITVNDYVGHSGPNLPSEFDVDTAGPLDFFWLLFSADLFRDMARHTNSYAQWRINQTTSGDPYWTETTPEELRAFVGVNILMGINQLPEFSLHWSSDKFLRNDGISQTLTLNRFKKLNQYFHISDRSMEPSRNDAAYDRLYKVRPIMEHVSKTFNERYTLGKQVAVDEAMVKYTGKLSFRQYMPQKPIKRGMKIWMLCDSNTSFLSRFEVYLGRTGSQPEHGLGHRVVTSLTSHLEGSYRQVYFDNFFSSIQLMQDLLVKKLYACGTVRVNRVGFPTELKKPRNVQERGDYMVKQMGRSNLTATVWKDRRLVHHVSTLSEPTDVRRATRRSGAQVLNVQQPASVYMYNQYMGGVDTHDQLRMNYEVGRNGKKWWRYLFWFFINCAIVNAFVMFRDVSRRTNKKKRFSHLDFRLEVAEGLIGGFTGRKRKCSESRQSPMMAMENVRGHVLSKLSRPKGRCRYHLKNLGVRKETVYGCSICNVHLCKDGCHSRFHNM